MSQQIIPDVFKAAPPEEIIKGLTEWLDTEFIATTLYSVAVECGIPLTIGHLRILWLKYQDMLEIDLTIIAEDYIVSNKLVPNPDEPEESEEGVAHARSSVVQESETPDRK